MATNFLASHYRIGPPGVVARSAVMTPHPATLATTQRSDAQCDAMFVQGGVVQSHWV